MTLSLDDETYRHARIAAAERNQSVSALVRNYLRSLKPGAASAEQRSARLFTALDRTRGFRAAARLTREETHDRKHSA